MLDSSNVIDFSWTGDALYVLLDGSIYRADALTAGSVNWISIPIQSIPATATSLEVTNGLAFIGDETGRLWCARLDG